jgi:hypothetical protein
MSKNKTLTMSKNKTNSWPLRILQLLLGIAVVIGCVYGWKELEMDGFLTTLVGLGGLSVCYNAVRVDGTGWLP